MRIVDAASGQPIDWGRSFMRNFVLYGLLGAIPVLGFIYRVVGACFVFNDDRRPIWEIFEPARAPHPAEWRGVCTGPTVCP